MALIRGRRSCRRQNEDEINLSIDQVRRRCCSRPANEIIAYNRRASDNTRDFDGRRTCRGWVGELIIAVVKEIIFRDRIRRLNGHSEFGSS